MNPRNTPNAKVDKAEMDRLHHVLITNYTREHADEYLDAATRYRAQRAARLLRNLLFSIFLVGAISAINTVYVLTDHQPPALLWAAACVSVAGLLVGGYTLWTHSTTTSTDAIAVRETIADAAQLHHHRTRNT
ncbi:hypothetical protein BH93_27630 (plasmid) [Rhodococcoides fascians A25f]|uniref:hypothetical protein n=1 Tax=Rhodococcoides fascians TaxID=1828 RepID=UPI0005650EBC|nr:hypothetical protein [Rhodococcus fascians]QII09344.1 hypothetical protein BH93_27630 [Rhodococcus fascians A25f]